MSERDGGDVKPECFYLCEDRCQFQAPGPHFFIEPEAGLSPGPGSEGPTEKAVGPSLPGPGSSETLRAFKEGS